MPFGDFHSITMVFFPVASTSPNSSQVAYVTSLPKRNTFYDSTKKIAATTVTADCLKANQYADCGVGTIRSSAINTVPHASHGGASLDVNTGFKMFRT